VATVFSSLKGDYSILSKFCFSKGNGKRRSNEKTKKTTGSKSNGKTP
jgi:hypothetical protein